jgi:3-isopropylmalate/(R)-2-methylmalate dehydratase large subunit
MTRPKTVSEEILSAKSGTDARAGDVVVCTVDWVLGTDASSPMAIDYFEKMGGHALANPDRVVFSFDHYSPPTTPKTKGFHDRVRAFVERHGGAIYEVGEGISHQVIVERGDVLPGDLVIGADSHTVTCGALNLFATGVGSSDLAAAMLTGQIWLCVPETIRVRLTAKRGASVAAKDVALALVALVGAEGANYQALEFVGPGLADLAFEDRLVIANLAVEMGAKAALFPADEVMYGYLAGRTTKRGTPVEADPGAHYAREIAFDLSTVSPRVALPHAPDNGALIEDAIGVPIQMVFVGTCTGGRVHDVHEVLDVLRRGGGRIAANVQLVVTPASREIERRLTDDGSLDELKRMGVTVTTPGCGACCGTSGVIPAEGTNVLSTANRNFKARMGPALVSIYLASPAACAAAALTGRISDPRLVGVGR